jgi:hypothetical protein
MATSFHDEGWQDTAILILPGSLTVTGKYEKSN